MFMHHIYHTWCCGTALQKRSSLTFGKLSSSSPGFMAPQSPNGQQWSVNLKEHQNDFVGSQAAYCFFGAVASGRVCDQWGYPFQLLYKLDGVRPVDNGPSTDKPIRHQISRPMRIVAPIFLFPLASKKGLIALFCLIDNRCFTNQLHHFVRKRTRRRKIPHTGDIESLDRC